MVVLYVPVCQTLAPSGGVWTVQERWPRLHAAAFLVMTWFVTLYIYDRHLGMATLLYSLLPLLWAAC